MWAQPPDMESTRMFRPAGSEEAITVHDQDMEIEGGWKWVTTLLIGQDEHRRDLLELLKRQTSPSVS